MDCVWICGRDILDLLGYAIGVMLADSWVFSFGYKFSPTRSGDEVDEIRAM